MRRRMSLYILIVTIVSLAFGWVFFGVQAESNRARTKSSTKLLAKSPKKPDPLVQWQIYAMFDRSAITEVSDPSGRILASPKSPTENIMFDCGDTGQVVRVVIINFATMKQSKFEKLFGGYIVKITGKHSEDDVVVLLTDQLSGKQIRDDRRLELKKTSNRTKTGLIKVFFRDGKFTIIGGRTEKGGKR